MISIIHQGKPFNRGAIKRVSLKQSSQLRRRGTLKPFGLLVDNLCLFKGNC
ncbi:MAG: hypothetical protein PWK00_10065 [Coxiella burnetii]|nr:hypothetical protein [Coxiella burnetii]